MNAMCDTVRNGGEGWSTEKEKKRLIEYSKTAIKRDSLYVTHTEASVF